MSCFEPNHAVPALKLPLLIRRKAILYTADTIDYSADQRAKIADAVAKSQTTKSEQRTINKRSLFSGKS